MSERFPILCLSGGCFTNVRGVATPAPGESTCDGVVTAGIPQWIRRNQKTPATDSPRPGWGLVIKGHRQVVHGDLADLVPGR